MYWRKYFTAPTTQNKNFCIIDFVLLYIIINIYINKTKNSNHKKLFQSLKITSWLPKN
jgi:hypothetical protein